MTTPELRSLRNVSMGRTGSLVQWRTAGSLLTGSLLIVLVAGIVMVVSGAVPAFFDFLDGSLAGLKPYLPAFRASTYLWVVAWISLLLGSVALTRLLVRSGDDQMAILALAATVVATVLAILEATFTIGVTTWAIEEAASTGTTPQVYTVLDDGLLDKIQFVYTVLGFAGQVGFGAALVKTSLLPRWVAMTALVWALVWLILDPFFLGIPAVLLFMPAGIGVALLLSDRTAVTSQSQHDKETIDG